MSERVSSWDEDFSDHYDEWSAHMSADIDFYVDLARGVDGPLVELGVAMDVSPSPSRWQQVVR